MVFLFLQTYLKEPCVQQIHQLACTYIHYTIYQQPKQAF
nr:MAG TPA: hypothetical protein [Caudoviricetes sp.]